jgi:enoyl-CoA hydratase/carnithine racemase
MTSANESPTFDTLEVSVDGPRGQLVLNRPEKLNPLSNHTLRELEEAARWFDTQDELKVVVVSGRGRAFSSGADVSRMGGDRPAGATVPRDRGDQGWRMARAIEEMRAVTVARLQGWCIGGGVVLAAACDLRVAATTARFSIPEVELGIPLAWGGIPRLVREIGPALTKELVMTCREFSAAEAAAAGFLNRVVAEAELDHAVEELVTRLVRMPRLGIQATKTHTNAVTEAMVGTGRSWGDHFSLVAAGNDPEGVESGRAYLERVRANRART